MADRRFVICHLSFSPSKQPAQQRENDADQNARRQREIEREVPFLNRDIARQTPHPGKPARELPQERASDRKNYPDDHRDSADFLHHKK
jgi:hypothetical protein